MAGKSLDDGASDLIVAIKALPGDPENKMLQDPVSTGMSSSLFSASLCSPAGLYTQVPTSQVHNCFVDPIRDAHSTDCIPKVLSQCALGSAYKDGFSACS